MSKRGKPLFAKVPWPIRGCFAFLLLSGSLIAQLNDQEFARVKVAADRYLQFVFPVTQASLDKHLAQKYTANSKAYTTQFQSLVDEINRLKGSGLSESEANILLDAAIGRNKMKGIQIPPPLQTKLGGMFRGVPYAYSGRVGPAIQPSDLESSKNGLSLGVHQFSYFFEPLVQLYLRGSAGKMQPITIWIQDKAAGFPTLYRILKRTEFFGIDCSYFVCQILGIPTTTSGEMRSATVSVKTINIIDNKTAGSALDCPDHHSSQPSFCRTWVGKNGTDWLQDRLQPGDLIVMDGHVVMFYGRFPLRTGPTGLNIGGSLLIESTSGAFASGAQITLFPTQGRPAAITGRQGVQAFMLDGTPIYRSGIGDPKEILAVLRPLPGFFWGEMVREAHIRKTAPGKTALTRPIEIGAGPLARKVFVAPPVLTPAFNPHLGVIEEAPPEISSSVFQSPFDSAMQEQSLPTLVSPPRVSMLLGGALLTIRVDGGLGYDDRIVIGNRRYKLADLARKPVDRANPQQKLFDSRFKKSLINSQEAPGVIWAVKDLSIGFRQSFGQSRISPILLNRQSGESYTCGIVSVEVKRLRVIRLLWQRHYVVYTLKTFWPCGQLGPNGSESHLEKRSKPH